MKAFKIHDYTLDPGGKIAKRMIYTDKNIAAFVLNISQGASLPNHTHFDCTVMVHVLRGSGNIIVDGKPTPISPGDIIQLGGQEKMAIDNTGNGTISLYVSLTPNPPSEQYTTDVDI